MIPGITAQASTGASGTPNERWWRVHFINNNSGHAAGNATNAYIDIYQVELYTEIGGPGLVADAVATKAQPMYNPPSLGLGVYTGALKWNNAGNQGLFQGCFVAFKLNTPLEVPRFRVASELPPRRV